MADLAFIFHWRLEDMNNLTLNELEKWHQLAVERLKAFSPLPVVMVEPRR